MHCFLLLLEFNRVLDNGIIIKDLRCHSHVSVSSSQIKTTGKQTLLISQCKVMSTRLIPTLRHFSASDSRGTKPLCWRVRNTLRQDKQRPTRLFQSPFPVSACSVVSWRSSCDFSFARFAQWTCGKSKCSHHLKS